MQIFNERQREILIDITYERLLYLWHKRHWLGMDKQLLREFDELLTVYRILTNPSLYGWENKIKGKRDMRQEASEALTRG